MGGPRTVPEPVSRRLRCLWICMVWDFIIFFAEHLWRALQNERTAFAAHRGLSELSKDGSALNLSKVPEKENKFNFCSYVRLQSWSFLKLKTRQRRPHFMGGWGLVLFFCPFVLQPYSVSKFLRKTYICRSRWPPPPPPRFTGIGHNRQKCEFIWMLLVSL